MKRYDQRTSGRAIYAIALQDGNATFPFRSSAGISGSQLPSLLTCAGDLNFLDHQNPLFSTDYVLVSAGQYLGKRTPDAAIFKGVDRANVTVLGDSGGFQFITGKHPFLGDQTRNWSLRWLEEHTHVAMTLDIPTRAIGQSSSQFQTFDACLSTTLENLEYFDRHRTPGAVEFLNVLQGRDRREADRWFEAVKAFEFEGWAFAGALRLDMYEVCRRVIMLVEQGLLGGSRKRIHVLGTARLEIAVMLTALQVALRKHLDDSEITITFDSSSPSICAANWSAYTDPAFSGGKDGAFRLQQARLPATHHYNGSRLRFPAPGIIGARLTLGDVCPGSSATSQSARGPFTLPLLTNHNLERLLDAMERANAIMDLQPIDAEKFAPLWLVQSVQHIRGLFDGDPKVALGHAKRALQGLPQGSSEHEAGRFLSE